MSQDFAYGDDFTNGTNFPLIGVTKVSSDRVFYGRNTSFYGVAKTGMTVSTKFEFPTSVESGASNLQIVNNGIPSISVPVTIN